MSNFCYPNIEDLYYLVQEIHNTVKTDIVINIGKTTSFNIEQEITDKSTFGEQIKYYRKMKNIRIKQMMKDINIGYNTVVRLEQYNDNEYSFDHKGVVIINKVLDYLDIRDKIDYRNNEYLDFVINKQEEEIEKIIGNSTLDIIAEQFNVTTATITRWRHSQSIPSRENYYKIKKMLETR